MDWVWRICLAFGAMLLVRETEIWLVADYLTDGGLIINSLVYGAIVIVGVSPLFLKMFPNLMGGKQKSNSPENQTRDTNQPNTNDLETTRLSQPFKNTTETDDKISAARRRKDDEKLYEAVAEELSRDEKNEGLWLKAMAETDGDENKTKARYVDFRIRSLKDEKELAAQKSTQNLKTKKDGHKSEIASSDTQMSIETVIELLGDMNYTVSKTPIGFTIKEPMGAKVRIETEEKLLQYFRQKKSNKTGDEVQVNVTLLIEDLEKLKYRVKRKGNGFVVKEPLGGKAFLSSSYELEGYLKQKTNKTTSPHTPTHSLSTPPAGTCDSHSTQHPPMTL